MATAEHDIGYYLEAARELAGKVAAAANRIDGDRQLPSELAGEMADRGFFRLLLPRSLGGAQLDHPLPCGGICGVSKPAGTGGVEALVGSNPGLVHRIAGKTALICSDRVQPMSMPTGQWSEPITSV